MSVNFLDDYIDYEDIKTAGDKILSELNEEENLSEEEVFSHFENKEKNALKRKQDFKHRNKDVHNVEVNLAPGVIPMKKTKDGRYVAKPYIKRGNRMKERRSYKKATHKRNRRKAIEEEEKSFKGNHYKRSFDLYWSLD